MSTKESPMTKSRAMVLTGLIIAVVAFQLNATMLNPAVEIMARQLDVEVSAIAKSTSLFFLATGAFSIFVPRLSDMLGRKKVLAVSLILLIIGTVIAIWAPNIHWLYVGRVIQGTCGPVFALALLILREVVTDPEEYGTRMGILAAINGGIAGVDVILGGWMADNWGYRSVLVFTLVFAILALLGVFAWVPESRPTPDAHMDWLGVVLLIAAVITMTWTVGGDPFDNPYPGPMTIVYGVATLILAGAFVFWQTKSKEPFIPKSAQRYRAMWAMPLTTILTLAGVMGVVNLIVISFAQNPTAGFGMNAALASLLFMSPYALIGWLVGPFAGHAAPRIGYVKMLQLGLLASFGVIILFALFGLNSKWLLGTFAILLGITYAGVANVMLNGLGVVLSPPEAPGLLTGLNGASFGIGAGISFTVLGQFITAGSPIGSDSNSGYVMALWAAAVITLLAFLQTFVLPRKSPAGDKL